MPGDEVLVVARGVGGAHAGEERDVARELGDLGQERLRVLEDAPAVLVHAVAARRAIRRARLGAAVARACRLREELLKPILCFLGRRRPAELRVEDARAKGAGGLPRHTERGAARRSAPSEAAQSSAKSQRGVAGFGCEASRAVERTEAR